MKDKNKESRLGSYGWMTEIKQVSLSKTKEGQKAQEWPSCTPYVQSVGSGLITQVECELDGKS